MPAKKTELHIVSDANPIPPTADATPSAHTRHSAVYEAETRLRLSAFDHGIVTLTGDLESRHETHVSALEKLKAEYDQATAKAVSEFNAEKADLVRRIDDMQVGKMMASAALDAFERGLTS